MGTTYVCEICKAEYSSAALQVRCAEAGVPSRPALEVGQRIAIRNTDGSFVRRRTTALYVQNVTGHTPGAHEWVLEISHAVQLDPTLPERIDTIPAVFLLGAAECEGLDEIDYARRQG